MFAEGDDPLAAGDGTADSYVNYVPYAYFADDNNNYISQFYPPGYDLTTCKPFACHDGQPCA